MSIVPDDPINFTCAREARRETVYFPARLVHEHCERVRTRRGTRVLGPFRQSAADNQVGKPTVYTRLHEAVDLLAALAPDVNEAIPAARAAGVTHLNLHGTLIHTDHVAKKGPNKADLWWSGKHERHGGNIQVLPDTRPAPVTWLPAAGATGVGTDDSCLEGR